MKEKTIILASLRFHPAFVQHLVAFARGFQELGLNVGFLLDPEYHRFPELAALSEVMHHGEDLQVSCTHAIFVNGSTRNLEVATKLRRRGAKILYLYHEPWKPSLEFLKTDGLPATIRSVAVHRISASLIRIADAVVLESKYALAMYRKFDGHLNSNAIYFPQIYDDEAAQIPATACFVKDRFSYIGNISWVHAFDQYLEFMRRSLRSDAGLKFLIASRNPIPASLLKDKVICDNLDKIEIKCGQPLRSQEINSCYARSFCVWNLYRRSMQSGVLPKAYMFGTPVIASTAGSFPEFIEDGRNGRFASAIDHEGILSAVRDIRSRQQEYARNCRNSFLNGFYYRSRLTELSELVS